MDILREYGIKEDPRFKVAGKEALKIVLFWVCLTAWTYGWGIYGASVDPSSYTFILGFPTWYFWSCLGAGAVFPLIGIFLASRIQDCSLEPYEKCK